ncbi:MAG: hypothetical protein K0S45_3496 [Nitrospira sp.]|jgi:hypothetical protein|nr:hypothetical protein [Nitrospira sp.]
MSAIDNHSAGHSACGLCPPDVDETTAIMNQAGLHT